MATDIETGVISVNFATNDKGYNPGKELLSAFNKIRERTLLTRNEEYAVETIWHEIMHLMSDNKIILPGIGSHLGFPRASMETVNQFCARHSYNSFLKLLGAKASHQKWIIENGYSYNYSVNSLRGILKAAKINEDVFVRRANKLLMGTYEDFNKHIEALLIRLYKGKGDILGAFRAIEMGYIDKEINNLAIKS